MSAQIIALFMNTIVSVLASAKTESFLQFRYRFRPKTEMAVSASFGFGRNEKSLLVVHYITVHWLFHEIFAQSYKILVLLCPAKNAQVIRKFV